MIVIECPSCGQRGEVPDTFGGQRVRCRRCSEKLEVPAARPLVSLWLAVVLALMTVGGVASYWFMLDRSPVEEIAEDPPPIAPTPPPAPVEEVAELAPPPMEVQVNAEPDPEEVRRQEEARRKEEERIEQARLEKEQREREEAARLASLKRNPTLTAQLEEIDREPARFIGQYLIVDRVSVRVSAIAKHRELGRPTIGVTTPRGTYFSRVPISGLVISTSDEAAQLLVNLGGALDVLPRVKLWCEIRQWEKNGKQYPEAFAYRIEVYDSGGRVEAVVEAAP